jgi:hypothetical protein
LTVKAFDRNVGVDDTLLGQATTDAQGNHSIAYTIKQLGGNSAADLVICMYQDDKLLQTSDAIFNAQQTVAKDFLIPLAEKPEFQRLSGVIQPLLRNRISFPGLTKLQIDFLSKKTGIDSSKINWLAQSRKLAGGNETLATFYYAMLSQNLPADPAALLSRNRASIASVLQRAGALNLIPTLKTEDVNNILDNVLPKLRAENLLNPALPGQQASLGDIYAWDDAAGVA